VFENSACVDCHTHLPNILLVAYYFNLLVAQYTGSIVENLSNYITIYLMFTNLHKDHFFRVIHVVNSKTALVDEEIFRGIQTNEQFFCTNVII